MDRRSLLAMGLLSLFGLSSTRAANASNTIKEADATAAAPWVAMQLSMDNSIRIPVCIKGVDAFALLDSGSTSSVLSFELADRLGISATRRTTGAALASHVELGVVANFTLEVGGVEKRLGDIVISDLSHFATASGQSVDLLLGHDFLRLSPLFLDFSNRRIGFASPPASALGGNWRSVPLDVSASGELLVTARIGARAGGLLFDMGNASPLLLSEEFAKASLPSDGARRSTALLGTIAGVQTVDVFTLPDFLFGGARAESVPAASLSRWVLPNCVGSMGLPLIGQFDLVLELAASRLLVRRSARPLRLNKDRSGLGIAVGKDLLTVVHVAPGSPASAAGFLAGNVIVRVDGAAIDSSYLSTDRWRWRYGEPGTKVQLVDSSGRERLVVLHDYY